MPKRGHPHARLFATYRNDPTVALPGWVLYEDTAAKTPIGILPEPIGGTKNGRGRSPYQQEWAQFLVHAANHHEALIQLGTALLRAVQTTAKKLPARDAKPLRALITVATPMLSAATLPRNSGTTRRSSLFPNDVVACLQEASENMARVREDFSTRTTAHSKT